MTDWEREVLKAIAGRPSRVTGWGAVVGATLGPLKSMGYLTPEGKITPAGRAALEQEDEG